MFIRITKTLGGLGSYLVYGIFVLIVEVLGATTTLIYGALLLPLAVPSFVCCAMVCSNALNLQRLVRQTVDRLSISGYEPVDSCG